MTGDAEDREEMVRLYVDEHLSTSQIARLFGKSAGVVWARLRDAGVEFRQRGNAPKLDPEDLRRWYVEEGQSTLDIAEHTGMSTSGVTAALQRAGIDRRPLEASELEITDDELACLYLDERVDDDEIGRRYAVPTWTVRQRLRTAGIRRPNGALPGGDVPMPSTTDLRRLYETEQRTLADIGAHYGVPDPTVRRWLEIAEIPIRERPSSAGRRPEQPPDLDRETLWQLYVTERQTAAEIAAEVGVTKNVITTALHAQRIPVRPAGPSRKPPVVLLDALYEDPDISAALHRHGIPTRPEAGELRARWPEPVELSPEALEALYVGVGLSAAHISMLTGVQVAGIRHRLQRAGLTARGGGRSPWKAERADVG